MTHFRHGKSIQRPGRQTLAIGLLSLLAALAGAAAAAAAAVGSEMRVSQVKAAFILNIAKFVDWPTDAAALSKPAFTLCYYREDTLGSGVEIILNKRVRGRRLDTMLIENLSQSEGCGILLIPSSQLEHFTTDIEPAREQDAILTIADLTASGGVGGAYRGVVMNFVRRDASIGFEVNPQELKKRGLSMSSELLKLARIIADSGGEE